MGVGSPAAAFVGAVFGHLVSRRSARELEARSHREQMMRTLQWAEELAVSDDESKAGLGLRQMRAVDNSGLTDVDVQTFVAAALDSVVSDPATDLERGSPDVSSRDETDDVPSDAPQGRRRVEDD